MIAPNK